MKPINFLKFKVTILIPFVAVATVHAAEITCIQRLPSQTFNDYESAAKKSAEPKSGQKYKNEFIKKLGPYLGRLTAECVRANKGEKFPVKVDLFLEIDSEGENTVYADSVSPKICACLANAIPSTKEYGPPPGQPFMIHLGLKLKVKN